MGFSIRNSAPVVLIALLVLTFAACSASAATPPSPTSTRVSEVSPTETQRAGQPLPTTTPVPPSPTATRTPVPDDANDMLPLTPVVEPSPTHTTGTPQPTPTPAGSGQVQSMFGPITCDDSVGDVTLTHHIYDPDMFDSLTPMGRIWGSHVTPVDHLYFNLDGEQERDYARTPAAGSIIHIARFPHDQSPFWDESILEPDYRIIVAHSCTLFSIYIHLGDLAPEVTSVVGEIGLGERWDAGPGEGIQLDAGDPVALLGGSSFDYSLNDENIVLSGFQIPEHYEGEAWKIHTADPFDYMTPELVAELLPKDERQVEPFGGKIDYDVPGTLAGNWFMDGTIDYRGNTDDPEYWHGHLTIVYDYIDPSQIRIALGRDIGLTEEDCRICGGAYAVVGNSPDPAGVTVETGIVKYEFTGRETPDPDRRAYTVSDGNVLGTFLVQVIDDQTIRAEFFLGKSASEVSGFTGSAALYRR